MRIALPELLISLLLCLFPLTVAYGQTSGIVLSAEEQQYLETHNPIVFISQNSYPPFEFSNDDGMSDGMTIELVRWLATELGFRSRFRNVSFLEAQQAVLSGQADVLTSLFYSKKRDQQFDFTQPLFNVPASIFVLADRPDIVRLEDLDGKRVAIQAGDYAADFLDAKGIDFTLVPTQNFSEAADAVIDGTADLLIGDEQIVLYYLYSHGLIDKVKKVGVPLYSGINCMGLKDGDRVLQSILNKGISHARDSGVLDRLTGKWLGTTYPTRTDYWGKYWPYLLAVLGLVLFVVIWNLRLRRAVELKTRDLRESEQKFRTIFDQSYEFIGLMKPDGTVLDVNRTALNFSGEDKENLLNLPFWETVWWQHSEAARKQLKEAIRRAGVGEIVQFETTNYSKSGEVRTLDCSITPLFNEKGEVTLLIPEGRDISERKQMEMQLQESKERFRELIEQSPIGLALCTMDGVYVQVSSAFANILGRNIDETLQLSYWDVTPDEYVPLEQQQLQQLEVEGRCGPYEKEYRHKDGHFVPVRLNCMVVMRHGEPFIWSSVEDITALKNAENEMKELADRLRQSQKMEAIGTLAGGVAHDFNNILAAILGYTELSLRNPSCDDKCKKNLKYVLRATERAKELVKQILMFSRKGEQNREIIKLTSVVGESIKLLQQTIPSTISIRAEIDDSTGVILADSTQVQQVVMNLCTNAYHAMPEQGGEILIRVKPIVVDNLMAHKYPGLLPGEYGQLTISDSGAGMSPEVLTRIFDPFYTTKKQGEGTGMGLSVVHGIVQNHDGFISVESIPEKGTTFNVFFPLSTKEAERKEAVDSHNGWQGTEHILLIDDEKMLVELWKEILEYMGYRVTATTSAVAALAMFQADPASYDLIVTDQTMPEMAGDVLTQKALQIRSDLPVIICTGHSAVLDAAKAMEIGAKALLMKPVNSLELSQAVREVFDKRE
ncbi:PAS domain S-box-containing protein [Desulfuromusa kysingii]|uniref:histidine kinase n=1 Tax=Desulfuromusa kysingii TaxID=37625 RepID=A0A1H4C5B6_9BACT|nr:transporter substrate-binding domain-containing protein [Desulfuromusa kysingii]SEA55530.1 PAS domain S-box-containing protein [Desulfuromusa kysingii]